jgi:Cupredoxin-like domain
MSNRSDAFNRRHLLAVALLASAAQLFSRGASAEDAVALSLTIKDRKFEPAELHAPAGRPLEIHVTNLNAVPSEFESGDLHFEKIVPVGKEAVIHVRPQQPGRYIFFDDFHREAQGALVVP